MKIMKHFFVVICLITFITNCRFFQSQPYQNTKIAFQYHNPTQKDIEFLSHFDIVVTGKFWDSKMVKFLRSKKVKLFYYEWLPAIYYCSRHNNWEEMIYQNRLRWTLDPGDSDPDPLGDQYGCLDLFYDMADEELLEARVDHIAHLIQLNNYDGVFFDWGGGWNELKERSYAFLMDEFLKRHPGIQYNDKTNEFLRKIKQKGILIMVNGGFRSDRSQLDQYADFDVVESMFTTTECIDTHEIYIAEEGIRKVCDTRFNTVQNSLDLAVSLPRKAAATNNKIQFFFLDYAFPYYRDTDSKIRSADKEYRIFGKTTDRQAVFYALACSYMGDASGFVAGPKVSLDSVIDDIYFYPVGKAVSNLEKINDDVYIRYFSNGIVILSDRDATVEVALPAGKDKVFDLYEKRYNEISNNRMMVNLASQIYPSGAKHPIGRIYQYEH